jgi:hypothetical protein
MGDGCYGHISHQQGTEASGQENQIVRNTKPDHPVNQEVAIVFGPQQG